jgi:hypothetical protein
MYKPSTSTTISILQALQLNRDVSPNIMEAVIILHGDKVIAKAVIMTCGINKGSPWSVQADGKF